MPPSIVSADQLTRAIGGEQVTSVTSDDKSQLTIHFSSGVSLVVKVSSGNLVTTVMRPKNLASKDAEPGPTKRQLEYLTFIAKYTARFGGAPAESDIQRHFLVSAPTVNQMMQTLERCGYVSRQKGIPRSVRVCIALAGNV